jgi:hypothetical protein
LILHDGQYVHPPGIRELCKDVLRHCRQREASPIIAPTLSLESFWGKIRKWREATTTSPSGQHLRRYKALFTKGNHTPDQVDEQAAFSDKQTTIAKLIITVLNYCIRSGHVLTRWETVINTMIFKEPGNFQIHRLRVLHIYKADFNLLLAGKWRNLLRAADSKGWVNANQYGARSGCEALSLAAYEAYCNDIAYSTRRTVASVDNDAKSCFDQMIPPLVSLTNRAYGLPSKLAVLHGETLQSTKYFISTWNLGYLILTQRRLPHIRYRPRVWKLSRHMAPIICNVI